MATEGLDFIADYEWIDVNGSGELLTGIAIFAAGGLEGLYIGNELTVEQIMAITTGDGSEAALNNAQGFYGVI